MKASIERLYYSITEVSKLIGEEQHVLRYWEREFTQLKPQKNRAGNRVYAEKDLDVLKVIRKLLREERYTVAGAKEYLRLHGVQGEIQLGELIGEETAHQEPEVAVQQTNRDDKPVVIRELATEIREIASSLRRKANP